MSYRYFTRDRFPYSPLTDESLLSAALNAAAFGGSEGWTDANRAADALYDRMTGGAYRDLAWEVDLRAR